MAPAPLSKLLQPVRKSVQYLQLWVEWSVLFTGTHAMDMLRYLRGFVSRET